MLNDPTSRIVKIGDALSQLVNVAALPRHRETTANESVSGRAYREGWRAARWIDAAFFWQRKPGHCERAYLSDLDRAIAFKAQHRLRP
jgi:hypothetical protein